MPQLFDLLKAGRRAKAAAGLEHAGADIDAGLDGPLQNLGRQPSHLQDHLEGQPQFGDRGKVLAELTAVAVGQGPEVRHHIEFIGTGGRGPFGLLALDLGGNRAEGEADHTDQLRAPPAAWTEPLPGEIQPAGGQADPGKAEVFGLIAAAEDGLLALVGIQQGVIDQGSEIGQVAHSCVQSLAWMTPNPPWLRR